MTASTRAEVLEADGHKDEAGELLRRNLTAAETFGSRHFFAKEAERELIEFEERRGSMQQPMGV